MKGKGNAQSLNRVLAPTCGICGKTPVYYSRVSGTHLCDEHFLSWFEDSVRTTLCDCAMVETGDVIAVALSGGKDSSVLLEVLHRIFRGEKMVKLVALTVDEGITGYREDTVSAAVRLAARLDVPLRTIAFSDLFGETLDALVPGREQVACSICGTLRRRALNILAREEGATKLATGHCLDDESQSVLMNYLRGDLTRTFARLPKRVLNSFVPRIKPLRYISEREVVVYGMLRNVILPLPECPYTQFALRGDVRRMLGIMEYRYPGTLMKILRGQEELVKTLSARQDSGTVSICPECGDPSSGTLCASCTLLNSLGIRKK
ncbi:MAG: TIGR00269 family protein [Methanoregulaceae archaeon]